MDQQKGNAHAYEGKEIKRVFEVARGFDVHMKEWDVMFKSLGLDKK